MGSSKLVGTAVAFEFDLADQASVKSFVEFGVSEFEGVDLLYNVGANVGPNSAISRDANVVDLEVEPWEQTMQVNLRGYLFTCKYAIPEMLKRGGGAIVNTSSTGSVIGLPEQVAYGVSKAGVEALTRSITNRWAKEGIRANTIAPGLIHTPTGDDWLAEWNIPTEVVSLLGRGGYPEEVASLVAFLLSEECPYLIGQVISLNGGSFLSPQ